jgi:arsenate reductase
MALPKGILFLCVENAARSQIAEGLARSILPASVAVFSAGSRPSRVRPEAVEVMREIGIDISAQLSKSVATIPADRVDCVVTLCAGEGCNECPVFLGRAEKLDWPLPDPAAPGGSAEERLEAFRRTRDELRRRITAFLAERGDGPMPR